MKTWKKVLIGITAAVVLLIIVGATVAGSRKGIVTVQTGKVVRQDISSVVTASGEIKPKTYVNVGANAFGKITHLYVKEGALVKKGQLLAQLENVQSSADLAATRASVGASETDYVAADAAYKTSAADLKRAQSDLDRAGLEWDRAQGMFKAALIAKADYDIKKAAWETAVAGLEQARARVAQAKAQQVGLGLRDMFVGRILLRLGCLRQNDVCRALRRHRDQPARPRGRDRGHRHPE